MPDDIAGTTLARMAAESPDEADSGAYRRSLLKQLESTAIGVRSADGTMRVRRREQGGCFLYGPYLHLPQGRYRVSFRCDSGRPRLADQPVLGIEVIVLSRFQQQWCDFTARELAGGTAALEFDVAREHSLEGENEGRFEFRFFHLANADLCISAVDIERLPAAEVAELPPRRWRLLGRLQKSWLGWRNGAGGVAVPRGLPAGCVLYGGWPYLRLPRGNYRLLLSARAGAPLFPNDPVLGIDIRSQSRWRAQGLLREAVRLPEPGGRPHAWRDATAAEIATGPITVDFAVPTEIALEAGADAPFEIKVRHLGNASVTIDAVDLIELGEPETQTPSRWRLLGRLRQARIGERSAAGAVSVRDGEPAGRLLFDRRGLLSLAEGLYRLNLRGDAATEGPLLRAEVTAHPSLAEALTTSPQLLAHRNVTGTELASGTSIDFEVPAALAGGAGDWGIAVAVDSLGAGGFALRDLDVTVAETVLAAPHLRPSGRRKIVMIGNCQSETLRQGFTHIESLNRRFEVKYHFVQLPRNLQEFAARDLETCDILMIQDIRLWDEFPLRDHVRPGADQVRFPLVRFGSPWPFDTWNGPGDKEAHHREAPNLTFPYLDGLLGRLRRDIPDREARFQAYRSLETPGIVNYRRLHDMEARRLIAIDEKYDCRIGAFILENFRKRRVFHTTARPNWEVFNLMMRFVAQLVGVIEPISLTESIDASLRNPQVPIHPRVARDLGIEWVTERTRYLSHGRGITWEAYIRSYIEHYG